MVKVLDFHLSSKIRNQMEVSNLNHFTGNVRTWSSNDLQIVGQQSGFRIQLFRRLRRQPKKDKFLTRQIKFRRQSSIPLPHGLVVRIRRSHRRGPGSIPGVGMSIQFFNFIFIYQRFKKSLIIKHLMHQKCFHIYCRHLSYPQTSNATTK